MSTVTSSTNTAIGSSATSSSALSGAVGTAKDASERFLKLLGRVFRGYRRTSAAR